MATRTLPGLLLALATSLACTSVEPQPPAPAPVQPPAAKTHAAAPDAPASPDPAPAPVAEAPDAAPDGERVTLSDGVTTVLAPTDYVPLSEPESERLRLATLRRNPRATAELDGRRSSRGIEYGMTAAMRIENADLPSFYGESVHTSATLLRQQAADEFAKLAPGSSVELRPNAAGRYIDLLVTAPIPERGELRLHSRHWATPAGVVYEVGCQCTGPGCAYGHDGCLLPEPPADAARLDEPIHGGQAPQTLTVADGLGQTSAAPFFTEPSEAELEALVDSVRKGDPRMKRVDVQARLGPRQDTGIVMLTDVTWCSRAKDGCTAEQILEASRDAQVAAAVLEGFEPTLSLHTKTVGGISSVSYEMRVGVLSWERHLFWQDGPRVRELSCLCGGPACAVVEPTCRLEAARDGAGRE